MTMIDSDKVRPLIAKLIIVVHDRLLTDAEHAHNEALLQVLKIIHQQEDEQIKRTL